MHPMARSSVSGGAQVGGITGDSHNGNGSFSQVSFNGTVSGTSSDVGGIVGRGWNSGNIEYVPLKEQSPRLEITAVDLSAGRIQ